jgi:NADPH2:quinone reductase
VKAAFIERTGPSEVIMWGDLPDPVPGPREALVRVRACAVNPIDTYVRAGSVSMPLPLPFVVGCDLTGEVVAVGPDVDRLRPGARVWGSNQGLLGRQGTFAELAAVDEKWLYPLPDAVSDRDAAAAALVSITAHLGLVREARVQPGETVFVNGGSGGVGSAVVQIAKILGARVIATAGSAAKQAAVRGFGADVVIDYRAADLAEQLRFAAPDGVHVWWETQREPDFDRAVAMLAERGRMVIMAGRDARPAFPVGPFYVKGLSLHGFAMFNMPAAEQRVCAEEINRWFADGKLKAVIGTRFSLPDTAAAHAHQESNSQGKAGTLSGKIVIEIP